MRRSARVAGEIAELAQDVAATGCFRARLLDVLDREVGFDKASVHRLAPGSHPESFLRGWERPEEFANLPQYMTELAPHEVASASEGKPVIDTEALSLARRDQLALYQRFLRPEKVTLYATVMWRSAPAVVGLALARTGRSTFTSAQKQMLEELLPAVRLADALVAERRTHDADAWLATTDLSAREREVCTLVIRGFTNPEIAAISRVSLHTVRNQLAAAFRKLDVSTRAELVFVATSSTALHERAAGAPPPAPWTSYLR